MAKPSSLAPGVATLGLAVAWAACAPAPCAAQAPSDPPRHVRRFHQAVGRRMSVAPPTVVQQRTAPAMGAQPPGVLPLPIPPVMPRDAPPGGGAAGGGVLDAQAGATSPGPVLQCVTAHYTCPVPLPGPCGCTRPDGSVESGTAQ